MVLAVAMFVAAHPSRAQDVSVVSTDPTEDQTNVASEYRVEFELSQPTPPFGTDFLSKFFWSPKSMASVGMLGHAFDNNNELTIVFFEMTHDANVDMSFFAFGVESESGNRMGVPIALNYTTASSSGSRTIDGAATFGSRKTNKLIPERAKLEPLLKRNLVAMAADGVAPTFGSTQASMDLGFTVVVLLEEYFVESDFWTVKSATVADASGNFTFDNVRDGGFYPLALNFADNTGSVIGSYGYYDPDGDFTPDPIPASGNLSSIALSLYSFETNTAAAYTQLAETNATAAASDNLLMEIFGQFGPSLGRVFEDGSAFNWRYRFYSPTLDKVTSVTVDPLTVSGTELPVTGTIASQLSITPNYIDSGTAMATAVANGGSDFIDDYPDTVDVRIQMEGGDLDLDFRPALGELFWKISFLSPENFPFARLDVFVDLETGEVLEAGFVANETVDRFTHSLGEPYPNPTSSRLVVPVEVQEPGYLKLEILDLLGRVVLQEDVSNLAPGSHEIAVEVDRVPAGTYLVRGTNSIEGYVFQIIR